MPVNVDTWDYLNPAQNLPVMKKYAVEYQGDIPKTKRPLTMQAAQKLFHFLQSRYVLEEGEQFLRPEFFALIGGDCDDQAIYCASYYIAHGVDTRNIYFAEISNSPTGEYHHIYTLVDLGSHVIHFDALPDRRFNQPVYRTINPHRLSDI